MRHHCAKGTGTIKVKHQLHSNAGTEQIRASPVQTLGGVKGPSGVVVNKRGELVVVEKTEHCVSVFSPSREKLRSFRLDGSDKEALWNNIGQRRKYPSGGLEIVHPEVI